MVDKASSHNVQLVPHFKTHQSDVIGGWFKEKGVSAITVSSLKMGHYFAQKGWKDITVAFPVNLLEIKVINEILKLGTNLKVLVVSKETVLALDEVLDEGVEVLLELDAGYNRTGVSTDNLKEITEITDAISKSQHLKLHGLYCHPGNTYHADSITDIQGLWKEAIEKTNSVRTELLAIHPHLKIRIGDTPGCTMVEDMKGVDEIGPGNFVFYDLVMNYLGVCKESEIAVAVACPVVAKNSDRLEIVIHGGAVHFSKDHLFDQDENKFFGEVVVFNESGWSPIIEGIKLTSISQEHGILTASQDVFDQIRVGDVIGVLPIHSCLTANLLKSYLTLEGNVIHHLEKDF